MMFSRLLVCLSVCLFVCFVCVASASKPLDDNDDEIVIIAMMNTYNLPQAADPQKW